MKTTTQSRPLADIPNVAGYRVSLIHGQSGKRIPATVAKGADGCHYLIGESGYRKNLVYFTGWNPAL